MQDGAEIEVEDDGGRKKGKKKRSTKKSSLVDVGEEEDVVGASPVVDITVDQPQQPVVETKEEEGECSSQEIELYNTIYAVP